MNSTIAGAGALTNMGNWSHELVHALGAADMYSSACYAQGMTLMHCTAGASPSSFHNLVHLDPWHKMRLAWIQPQIYDLHFPGTAVMDVSQTLRSHQRSHAPAIFYDSLRGRQEFYMCDYRSRIWEFGTQTYPFPNPAAGYDTNMGAPQARGFGMWFYQTDAANNLLIRNSGIHPGANGTLQSSLTGPDDFVASPPRIDPGLDGILQSVITPDDDYLLDVMAYLSVTPANYLSRRASNLYTRSSAQVRPQWFDRTLLPEPFAFDETASATTGIVQWGSRFAPFLANLYRVFDVSRLIPNPVFAPGEGVVVSGGIGRGETSQQWKLRSLNGTFETTLAAVQYAPGEVTLHVPEAIPIGTYRVVAYRDATLAPLSSNTLPIRLWSAYHIWRDGVFSASQVQNSAISGVTADPDMDGLPKYAEFVVGTAPLTFTPGSAYQSTSVTPSTPMRMEYPAFSDRLDNVTVTPEYSSDLVTWQTVAPVLVSVGLPGTTSRFRATAPAPGARGFMRLRFTYVGGL